MPCGGGINYLAIAQGALRLAAGELLGSCQHLREGFSRVVASIENHCGDLRRVVNVLERVGVEHDEIGQLACRDRAEIG